MILGDVLDAPVTDAAGTPVGFVVDARFVLDAPPVGMLATPRLHSLLVSPRTGTSFLGYERRDVNTPAILARYLAWRHRGTFLVLWRDVAEVRVPAAGAHAGEAAVTLRAGYRRWSPAL
jgi:hypothetical protein